MLRLVLPGKPTENDSEKDGEQCVAVRVRTERRSRGVRDPNVGRGRRRMVKVSGDGFR